MTQKKKKLNFNPRTHGECDGTIVARTEKEARISIHALTGSATWRGYWTPRRKAFQSTHSRGVRPATYDNLTKLVVFQSTHSRGVRLGRIEKSMSTRRISIHALTGSATNQFGKYAVHFKDFNPRTHGECDLP